MIESLYIPESLVDLKDGLCLGTHGLRKIEINSNNQRYFLYNDNKMIIGKSSIENEYFDVIVFVACDVKKVIIPNFIKHIFI